MEDGPGLPHLQNGSNNGGMSIGSNKQQEEKATHPQYSMPGILHFLQTEWARFEMERSQWEVERAELQVLFPSVSDHLLFCSSAFMWRQSMCISWKYRSAGQFVVTNVFSIYFGTQNKTSDAMLDPIWRPPIDQIPLLWFPWSHRPLLRVMCHAFMEIQSSRFSQLVLYTNFIFQQPQLLLTQQGTTVLSL